MTKNEIIKYWIDSSDNDYKTMNHLFKLKDYTWALFIGHLIIEKLSKALYVKMVDKNIPFSHNIILILTKSGIALDDGKKDILSDLNTFNIILLC